MTTANIREAERITGYVFANKSLLETALTFRSYTNECGGICNERLEYLGDSVLNMIVAEYLYRTVNEEEGVLTDLRKNIVSEAPLACVVREMGLLECCRLGKGARKDIANFKDKPTSDVFEAILGAVYLDGGIEKAKEFVRSNLLNKIQTLVRNG